MSDAENTAADLNHEETNDRSACETVSRATARTEETIAKEEPGTQQECDCDGTEHELGPSLGPGLNGRNDDSKQMFLGTTRDI